MPSKSSPWAVLSQDESEGFSSVVPIRPSGSATPIFLIHGVGGVVPDSGKLLDKIDASHPVYGIQSQAMDPWTPSLTTLEEMAAYYLKEIERLVPHERYCFIGFSFGGMIAFEMAQQLISRGRNAPFIGMVDSCEMSYLQRQAKSDSLSTKSKNLRNRLKKRFSEAFDRPDTLAYVREKIYSRCLRVLYSVMLAFRIPIPPSEHNPYHVNWFAAVNYVPKRYAGGIVLFKAKNHFWEERIPEDLGWGDLAAEGLQMFDIPGDHVSMFTEPGVSVLADRLTRCLQSFLKQEGVLSVEDGLLETA